MSSRKQEKERLRDARMEAEREAMRADRKRLWLGYAVAGVLAGAVLVAIVIIIARGGEDDPVSEGGGAAGIDMTSGTVPKDVEPDEREGAELPEGVLGASLEQAAEEAGCELQQDLEDEGASHLAQDAELPDYGTNPPTSGDHSPEPLADGAYSTTPSPLNYVHSLEHGRVELQYDSKLPQADQLELKGLFDADPNGMLMFPNSELDGAIAASAWTQLLSCPDYEGEATLRALAAFRDAYRGQGPEAIPL